MGRYRALIPLVLALVVAVLGSYAIYQWLRQRPPTVVESTRADTQKVAVAAADLPWGTKLTPEMIKTVPYLKSSVPKGSFSEPKELAGRVLVQPVKESEPILESRLAPTSIQTGGISAVLSAGKRAIAVHGDKVVGLAGLIAPGNRVDVLVTVKDPDLEMETTKIVLENVPVLAAGSKLEKGKDGEAHPVDVYTLEVTPEEGERLALASTQGKLQFALRNVTDQDTVLTDGATLPEVLAAFRPETSQRRQAGMTDKEILEAQAMLERQAASMGHRRGSGRSIVFIRGTDVTTVEAGR
ncbi:MAG: Flp pilus assembly protein CpaB [Desulfosoma sp.]